MELMGVSVFAVFVIALALVFDFTNGMHDAANSISTVVSTRVLSPRQAVVLGGILQFRGLLDIRHRTVASTIATDMVEVAVRSRVDECHSGRPCWRHLLEHHHLASSACPAVPATP